MMASHRRKRNNNVDTDNSNGNIIRDPLHTNEDNRQLLRHASKTTTTPRRRGGGSASRKKDDREYHAYYDDDDDDDVPFCCLTLKVGTGLAFIICLFCTIFASFKVLKQQMSLLRNAAAAVPPPPNWIVSYNDAFGIAQKYQLDVALERLDKNNNKNQNGDSSGLLHSFLTESAALRRKFQQRYGRHARSLLGHGLSSVQSSTSSSSSSSTSSSAMNKNNDKGIMTLAQYLAHKRESRQQNTDRDELLPEFRIWVLGNSAAAGYGNYHHEAYSHGLQRLLSPAFSAMGLTLQVQNLAMDGATEFPLSWCLTSSNYNMVEMKDGRPQSELPDVIVWDFPRSTVERLEAFLRHWILVVSSSSTSSNATSSTTSAAAPFFIFRDWFEQQDSSSSSIGQTAKKKQRKNKSEEKDPHLQLLEYYRQAQVLNDATLLVHEEQATKPFFAASHQHIEALPTGLVEWNKFGGPPGAASPDHIHPHLSLQQHELVTWLVGMHFLAALELVAAHDLRQLPTAVGTKKRKGVNSNAANASPLLSDAKNRRATATVLPKPLFLENVDWMDDMSRSSAAPNGASQSQHCYTTLEFMARDHTMQTKTALSSATANDAVAFLDKGHGQVQQVDSSNSVHIPSNLHQLLLPTSDGKDSTIGQDSELLLPKSGQWYNHQGWVLDMDLLTKRHKQRTRSHDFLGFADWRKAYFGASASGPLRLFLPVPHNNVAAAAIDSIPVLILCELPPFNEDDEAKRPTDPGNFRKRLPQPKTTTASCTLRQDVSISVGGIETKAQGLASIGSGSASTTETAPLSIYEAPFQPHCRNVIIPPAARLMRRSQAIAAGAAASQTDEKKDMTLQNEARSSDDYGLLVELTVTNPRVVWNQGPCSLSHVIYQTQ